MRWLWAFLSMLLAACGGGGGKSSFAFFGDSATAAPWLDVQPVPQIGRLADVVVQDYSRPGQTSLEAWHTFTEQLLPDKSTHVVIRYGAADCALYVDTGLHPFEQTLRKMIDTTRRLGKTPVLTTTVRIAPWPHFSDEVNRMYLTSLANYNAVIRRVGESLEVQVIDVYNAVPFFGREDMFDIVHPNQVYSDRISAYIAGSLP